MFIVQVQLGQLCANVNERAECFRRDERDARQLALQVLGVARAVLRAVQHGVDIVENVALGDGRAILCLELLQRPVGDVLAPVAAVTVRKRRSVRRCCTSIFSIASALIFGSIPWTFAWSIRRQRELADQV